MVQLVALGLIGGLGWYAWRALQRHMESVGEELEREQRNKSAKEVDALEMGEDGVYRPRKRDGEEA